MVKKMGWSGLWLALFFHPHFLSHNFTKIVSVHHKERKERKIKRKTLCSLCSLRLNSWLYSYLKSVQSILPVPLLYQPTTAQGSLQVWFDLGADGFVGVTGPGDVTVYIEWSG